MKKIPFFSDPFVSALQFAVPPVIIILLGKWFFEVLAFDFPQHTQDLLSHLEEMDSSVLLTLSLQESKARLQWLSSAILYLFVNGGFFILLWTLIKKHAYDKRFKVLISVALMSGLEILYLFITNADHSPIYNIFHFTYRSVSITGFLSASTLYFIHSLLNVINFLAIIAAPYVIITSCCIIREQATQPEQLTEQSLHFKELIQGASAVMVVGIIHMQLWLSWPLSLTSELPHINEMKGIILAVIQYWGICYTLTIAALYLPVSAHLRKKALIMTSTASSVNMGSRTHPDSSFQSFSSQITQIAAIMGPMLVGSIVPSLTDIFSL